MSVTCERPDAVGRVHLITIMTCAGPTCHGPGATSRVAWPCRTRGTDCPDIRSCGRARDAPLVSHIVTPDTMGRQGTTAYLGHLFVESRRHASGLPDLTDAEARSVGWWSTRVSRALRDVAGAEHVYAAVIGDAVPHLHIHLLPRFPGTPPEYWWTRLDEWPEARRGGFSEVVALVSELRAYLLDC
jgi:diadenosine tetraphosphate (Ap4A) HIT family hydrolase